MGNDRQDKLQNHQVLDSLEEYVLISQDRVQVECRRRQPNCDRWETTIYNAGDRVVLESIGLEIAIADLYQGVELTS